MTRAKTFRNGIYSQQNKHLETAFIRNKTKQVKPRVHEQVH